MKATKKKAGQCEEYADGSLWYQKEEDVLTLGVTSAYADRIGDVEDLILPEEGDQFEVGDIILTIQGNQSELELIAPANGCVIEVNQGLAQAPGLLNEDATGEGWIVRFRVEDFDTFTDFIEGDGGFSSRYLDDSKEGGDSEAEESAESEAGEDESASRSAKRTSKSSRKSGSSPSKSANKTSGRKRG